MGLIEALFVLLVWLSCFFMIVIVAVFAVFVLFGGYKYTFKQLWQIFKQMVVLTLTFTIIGGFILAGLSSLKRWFKN